MFSSWSEPESSNLWLLQRSVITRQKLYACRVNNGLTDRITGYHVIVQITISLPLVDRLCETAPSFDVADQDPPPPPLPPTRISCETCNIDRLYNMRKRAMKTDCTT